MQVQSLQFIPSAYASKAGFRGVLRVRINGKMRGTIPCNSLQPSAELATSEARLAALRAHIETGCDPRVIIN